MIDTYKVYEEMRDNKVLLSYKGEVSFDMIKSLLDIIEARLEREEHNPKTKKKVFNVVVECLQNLGFNIQDSEEAVINLWVEDGCYQVATGNYILKKNIERLQRWLEEINTLSKGDLRKRYKEILDDDTFGPYGGAGLGFIDIARKSGQPLNYTFEKVDDTVSFFSFRIQIPKD